jgi:hypothetical protein
MVWTAILGVIIDAFTGPRTGLVCHTMLHWRHSAVIDARVPVNGAYFAFWLSRHRIMAY